MDSLRAHLVADERSESSVHRLVRVRGRAERKRDLLHVCHRNHRAEQTAHQREELNVASDQKLQGGGIAALNVVVEREDLRLDTPARLVADGRPHLGQADVKRAVGRLVVILREGELGSLLRTCGRRRGPGDKRRCAGEK